MNVDLLKVVSVCNEICGKSVMLSYYLDGDIFNFNFSWFDGSDCEFIEDKPDNNISYTIAKFEVEKFVDDINYVLIGKFKFEYERYFK